MRLTDKSLSDAPSNETLARRSAGAARRTNPVNWVAGRKDGHEYLRRRAAVVRGNPARCESTAGQAGRMKGVEVPAIAERRAIHTSSVQGVTAGETATISESRAVRTAPGLLPTGSARICPRCSTRSPRALFFNGPAGLHCASSPSSDGSWARNSNGGATNS